MGHGLTRTGTDRFLFWFVCFRVGPAAAKLARAKTGLWLITSSVQKEVGQQLVGIDRINRISLQIRVAACLQDLFVYKRLPGELAIFSNQYLIGGIGHDLRFATIFKKLPVANHKFNGRCCNRRLGP